MHKEKKELIKKFKVVIEDLLDNYEEYVNESIAIIEEAKEDGEEVYDLDDLSDKYKSKLEDVIEKAGELGEELEKSEKEMTDEQKERFVKITKKMFEAVNE